MQRGRSVAGRGEERRKHQRLALQLPATLVVPDGGYPAQTRDISFGGAFVQAHRLPEVAIGEPCRVIIELADGVLIEVRGTVCRIEIDGMSVQFTATDVASYEHLKAVMLFNCPDPDRLLEELSRHPGLSVASDD